MSAGTFAEGRSAAEAHRLQELGAAEERRRQQNKLADARLVCGALGHRYRVRGHDSWSPPPTCGCERCGGTFELLDAFNDMFDRMEQAIEKMDSKNLEVL